MVLLAMMVVSGAILAMVFVSYEFSEKPVSEEESLKIAHEFLLNSPTFKFDGMRETVELVKSSYSEDHSGWEFVFTFSCRHAGYGDRSGQALLQVITPHTMYIRVEDGKVVYAVIDGSWDVIEQRNI